jgi:site-specific DNA-methyltransferase (adenine-specific)
MKLILGDCLEELKKIEDNSIDCVITSPPYDNLRTYKDTLEWGEHIWKPIIKDLFRVLKQGGVIVWVVGDATIKGSETGTSFRQALWAKECGFNLHDTMIYNKICYPPLTHNRYEQSFEYMFVWSKGKPKTFNPILVDCDTKGSKRPRYKSNKEIGSSVRNDNRVDIIKEKKIKNNVWNIRPNNTHHNHPAIFPEKLAEDHIRSWTKSGDVVLDPFMGSGTTGVVCKKLERDFIGIELVQEYYNLAKERIKNTPNSLFI